MTVGVVVLLLIAIEVILRLVFGFCDSPLSIESDTYEYICAPSQDRHRFGKHVKYNSYSQRSEEPDSAKMIVLGLGDSVINGGVMTDQDDLATTLAGNDSVQILNISAGSWGPDNCAAYLEEKGTFNAKVMLLVVSSHDAHDNITFEQVVGKYKSYPSRQYFSAIYELFDRYLIPRYFKKKTYSVDPDKKVLQGVGIDKGGSIFNSGFDKLKQIADSDGIEMHIYLHPERTELAEGKFNSQGIEIIEWARTNGVDLSTGFEYGESIEDFRDGIHFNAKGQHILASWMKDIIANR